MPSFFHTASKRLEGMLRCGHLCCRSYCFTNPECCSWKQSDFQLKGSVKNRTTLYISLILSRSPSVIDFVISCTSSADRTSTSSQHVRSAGICCRWSDDVQRSARRSTRSRSQHNIRTIDENTPFFCLSARLGH